MNNKVYVVYECGYVNGEWCKTMIAIFDNIEEVRNALTSHGCVPEDEQFKWFYYNKKLDNYYDIDIWTKNKWPWHFIREEES